MKGIIGLLLIFTGLAIGYYVMIGKFPVASAYTKSPIKTQEPALGQVHGASTDFGTPSSAPGHGFVPGGPFMPAHQMKWGVV